ncbi:PREDICTED: C-type lectin domain family 17, member A [Elephantulus edwardii]|uniref:C-type lectin domain family 17, member A n=1 Tax=Elephantulus edwardii TaxID=28737 RepID=UPI0003F07BEC|nr:PREDICTED: C-type lectin domain family 17, member A [Elephantulus edwardii]
MYTVYTNAGFRDSTGLREEEDDGDDYENMTPPYKDLPPKPALSGKTMKKPSLSYKIRKMAGANPEPSPPQSTPAAEASPPTASPVPWISHKLGGRPACCGDHRLMTCLYLLVVVSLLLGCLGLAVTLIKYQVVVEELRLLAFQQMAWQANVTGVAGLAGLKKDIDRLKADTDQSLVELRGLLDCNRVTCPEGWLPFEGKCYYFSPNTKPWDAARKFCQENYSHLVIISSPAEQKFVASAHGSPRVYWLGLTDKNQEGVWKWLDGSPVTLSFWDPQEPNNLWNEDCASMNRDGTWNDLACEKTTYWICERKCSC